MRQLELRASLEEARDTAALDTLAAQLTRDRQRLEALLAAKIDGEKDYPAAVGMLRELQFLARFGDEIGAAYEALEK